MAGTGGMGAIVGGLVVVTLAASLGAAAQSVQEGSESAQRLCGSCHALAPGTPSPVAQAPSLTTIGRKYPVADLGEALAEGIVTGHGPVRMPAFELDAGEIENLLAYLESIQVR